MTRPAHDAVEDALGLLCPLPVLRARRALARLELGQVLLLLADDEEIREDLPAWCEGSGQELLALDEVQRPGQRTAYEGLVRRLR